MKVIHMLQLAVMICTATSLSCAIDVPTSVSRWEARITFHSVELKPKTEYLARIRCYGENFAQLVLKRRPIGGDSKSYKELQVVDLPSSDARAAYAHIANAFKLFDFASQDQAGVLDGGTWKLELSIGSNAIEISHHSIVDLKQVSPPFAELLHWLSTHIDTTLLSNDEPQAPAKPNK